MTAILRQTGVLVKLILLYWGRAGVPNPVRRDQGRRASGVFFRIAFIVLVVNWGWRVGVACTRVPDQRWAPSVGLMLVGLFGAGVLWSGMGRVPGMRGVRPPTSAPLLDALPLTTASRVIVGLLERVMVYAITTSAFLSATPNGGTLRVVPLALLFATTALLVGEAILRFARVFVSPMRLARIGAGIVIAQLPFLLLLAGAPALTANGRVLDATTWLVPLARALMYGERAWLFALGIFVVAIASVLAIRAAERMGYDRLDVVPPARTVATKREELTLERVEGALARREPGGRWGVIVMFVYTTFAASGTLAAGWWLKEESFTKTVPPLCRVTIFIATFSAFILLNTRATRMVSRDAVARPLLAPLPITPADLLRGKARALHRRALLVSSPALLLLGIPATNEFRLEIAWRVGTMLVAVALAANATIAVAFLTQGLGAVRAFGASMNLESTLVAIPLFACAAPPYAWAALISVSALGLLSFEARRAALACVRWLDDGDDFQRETLVWKALLVFGAFQASSALGQRALELAPLDVPTKVAIAAVIGNVVLGALTAHGRRELPALLFVPTQKAWLAVGIFAGVIAGAFALVNVLLLRRLAIDLPLSATNGGAHPALVVLVLVIAPIAQEVFFRGWLQSAIAKELPRWKWSATILAAFAFAAVEPPLAFVPMFVLGLVSGVLFARAKAIGPSIIAHALFAVVAALSPLL